MNGTARRILLIDDSPEMRHSLTMMLRERGYVVQTANDGEHALSVLRSSGVPDVIILDLMMPVMSGWEFLDAKAADAAIRDVPVIILTAHEHRDEVRLDNVIGIFTKSGNLAPIIEKLSTHFSGNR